MQYFAIICSLNLIFLANRSLPFITTKVTEAGNFNFSRSHNQVCAEQDFPSELLLP